MTELVPFERYRGGHLITLPARLDGAVPTRLALDTGIGVNLISAALCERQGWKPTGESCTGRRMSGQSLTVPLTRVPSISVGAFRQENVVAGIADLSGFFPGDPSIEGILAPQFFAPWPFALNSVTRTLRVMQGEVAGRGAGVAVEVPLILERDGPALRLFVDLRLPSGSAARVEVDTGSDSLILHTRYMKELGVDPDRVSVRTVQGKDETGHSYTRFFAQVLGPVSLLAAPTILQRDPPVMFQQIIYDGLLGDAFLRSYDVTYDLAGSRLLFADPSL